MSDSDRRSIAVVGAGLGGAFAAYLLGRAGHRVTVFEKRPDPRRGPAGEGRSINLGISQRALDTLAGAGVSAPLADISTAMLGRLIHGRGGALDFRAYGERDGSPASLVLTPKEPVHAVQRAALARVLIEVADRVPDVEFRFESALRSVDVLTGALEFGRGTGGERTRVDAELIVGADGAFSTVRQAIKGTSEFDERMEELEIGYKQLTIRQPTDEAEPLRADVHHLWPRDGFVMTGLPNPDGSFTATLFAAREMLESISTAEDVRTFFGDHFDDVAALMPALEEEYLARPASGLVTLSFSPWRVGRAVLLGDACHAFMPFSGQGANAAILDAAALSKCLEGQAPNTEAGLEAYESERRAETDAIGHLSSVMTPLILWLAEPLMSPAGTR